jgi:hypothetical protein
VCLQASVRRRRHRGSAFRSEFPDRHRLLAHVIRGKTDVVVRSTMPSRPRSPKPRIREPSVTTAISRLPSNSFSASAMRPRWSRIFRYRGLPTVLLDVVV